MGKMAFHIFPFLFFFFNLFFRSDKEEMSDLQNYKIKGQNVKKKIEVLNSFYAE